MYAKQSYSVLAAGSRYVKSPSNIVYTYQDNHLTQVQPITLKAIMTITIRIKVRPQIR